MACIIFDGGVLAIWLGRCALYGWVFFGLWTELSYICILRSMGHWRNHQLEAVKGGLVKMYSSWAYRFHFDCSITPSSMFTFGGIRQLRECKEITEKGHGPIQS